MKVSKSRLRYLERIAEQRVSLGEPLLHQGCAGLYYLAGIGLVKSTNDYPARFCAGVRAKYRCWDLTADGLSAVYQHFSDDAMFCAAVEAAYADMTY